MNVKNELAKKAGGKDQIKLSKNMSIADMIKALEPEIARALPGVITPERFTRMALNDSTTHRNWQNAPRCPFWGR